MRTRDSAVDRYERAESLVAEMRVDLKSLIGRLDTDLKELGKWQDGRVVVVSNAVPPHTMIAPQESMKIWQRKFLLTFTVEKTKRLGKLRH
jgi:hypothetical protein